MKIALRILRSLSCMDAEDAEKTQINDIKRSVTDFMNAKILLVDDELDIINFISPYLTNENFEVLFLITYSLVIMVTIQPLVISSLFRLV